MALTWTRKLTTKHRVVFDVPEIENGYGVWRASLWQQEYQQTLGVPPSDTTTVLVLRHNAIVLAMTQAFWDKYQIGKARGGIALACSRAFGDLVALVAREDKVSETEAEQRARSMLVPGVIMQPSGVFAALYAQDFGCKYFRAT